jgi:hypothetical protein
VFSAQSDGSCQCHAFGLAAHRDLARVKRVLAIADGLVPQNKVAISTKLAPFWGASRKYPCWANQAL